MGPAQSGGKSDGGALDDAAHRIPALPGCQNGGLHPLSRRVVQNREGLCSHCFKKLRRGKEGKSVVCLRAHGGQVRPHEDPPAGQDLLGDAAGDAEGGRQAARKVAAAPHVRLALPLYKRGVIRVARAGAYPGALNSPRNAGHCFGSWHTAARRR